MSSFTGNVPFRFPHETRRLRLSVSLGCILIALILGLAMVWILVYQSMISSTEVSPELGPHKTQLLLSWYGAADKLMQQPAGIAFDTERSLIFVTDSHRACVFVLDPAGEMITSFTGEPDEEFTLELPTSIAVASNGTIYVVDAALKKLIIFDQSYQPIRAVSFKEEPPKGVAIVRRADGTEELWVVSYSGVTRGTLEGDFEWGYYRRGVGPGEFNNPTALAGLSTETSTTVFVCDTFNYRIQAFDVLDDTLRVKWIYGGSPEQGADAGGRGTARLLDLPVDVASDGKGQVFVLDGMGATIATLDGDTGELVTAFGTVGTQDGDFLYPAALTYGDDQIWVADQGNSRVSAFSQKESPAIPPLTRQHVPLELLWLLVALLSLIQLGFLLWLSQIRSIRYVLGMDALERIGARGKGAIVSEVLESINVAPGIESFAQRVCESARIATVRLSARQMQKLEDVRGELSSLDFDTLVAAKSLRKSILVTRDEGALFAVAKGLGIPVIDVTMLVLHVDSIIDLDEFYPTSADEESHGDKV